MLSWKRRKRMPDDLRLVSVESRRSWVAAWVALVITSVSYGSPLLVVVGLTTIQSALGTDRATLALASSLGWIGTGIGGVLMGRVADRIGIRLTALIGTVSMALGLAISASGSLWALFLGHGVFIGLTGNGALYPPLVVYVSRWFDRRRGTAVALLSSGQYVAGVVWPFLFQHGMAVFGWRATMLAFAAVVIAVIAPLAVLFLRPAPRPVHEAMLRGRGSGRTRILGLGANGVQGLLCLASFLCCVPMAMPTAHLVAFCTGVGIAPAVGASMLSVLLGCAFVSRQLWGWFADRYGGLRTVFAGSACQAAAIVAFALTQNETGLFVISAGFGFGFSAIIPAYVVAIRELFPSTEASWRVPLLLLAAMSGMAFGSWWAGLLYDWFGYYAPAFGSGALFNLGNLVVIGFLIARQGGRQRVGMAAV
jgi:MFS family permease